MAECRLCPRECGADRESGGLGVCRVGSEIKLARAALHFWEEPCISGERGSGTVFFSGCSLGCVYCQNRDISSGKVGKTVTRERLVDIFFELEGKGAHNINLVTPSHFIRDIAWAVSEAKRRGIGIPFVYNTSSYEKVSELKRLDGLIDIYLPDMKYYSDELAKRYSRVLDYFEVASAAIREMVRQTGDVCFDGDMLKKGVVVRHLILPGHTEDSMRILEHLHGEYGDKIFISIMNQYTPMPGIEREYPELGSRVADEEYDFVVDCAISLGITQAYIQDGEAASESFIPDFDCEGV